MPRSRRLKLPALRLLVLDVDGVMTDGRVHLDADGREHKVFNVRDGTGLSLWRKLGFEAALISGRDSQAVVHRARELRIEHVIQGSIDKYTSLMEVSGRTGVDPSAMAAMGDDLADLPMLRAVGFSLAPADAVPEVRAIASHVTAAPGGHGAVREAIEYLLRGLGRWQEAAALYDSTTAAPRGGRSRR